MGLIKLYIGVGFVSLFSGAVLAAESQRLTNDDINTVTNVLVRQAVELGKQAKNLVAELTEYCHHEIRSFIQKSS